MRAILKIAALAALGAALAGLAAAGEPAETRGGTVLPPAKEGYAYPECYCTDSRGRRVEVGQTACLQIGSRSVTSRCEKANNLVIWRHQEDGCAPGV